MKRILLFLSLFGLSLVGALLGAPSANASSPYDNLIQPTIDPIYIGGVDVYPKQEIGLLWSSPLHVVPTLNSDTTGYFDGSTDSNSSQSVPFTYFANSNNQMNGAIPRTAWQSAENWAVVQNDFNYSIIWTNDPDAKIKFSTGLGGPQIYYDVQSGFSVWRITIAPYCWNTNSAWTANGRNGCGASPNILSTDNYIMTQGSKLYFAMGDVVYPSDYEGNIINDTPVVPVEPIQSNYTPSFYISEVKDFKVTFSDSNFFTFDQVPFLCSDDLVPILHYEIWRRNIPVIGEVLMASGSTSASSEIYYDATRSESNLDYRIIGWYECGDNPQFEHSSYTDFTVTSQGVISVNLFDDCVTDSFPWVDPAGCMNNLYTVINMLVFGEVKFPSFTFDPSCHTLNTLDDWLNLPDNHTVCPQVPAFVRNITTPFIAFLLGIVTVGFLNKIRGDFDG